MLAFLVGSAVAGGTYLYAKKNQASTGRSAVAAAASGVASGAATALTMALLSALWPVLVLGGLVGGAYYFGKKHGPKALPPASGG